mmetsp:Transcript_3851/g.10867  ORF Transcript_3851/g.10867 Transcript_3851/m.10867 type:complete len:102 (-) Transcript_3851:2903-3208(-)
MGTRRQERGGMRLMAAHFVDDAGRAWQRQTAPRKERLGRFVSNSTTSDYLAMPIDERCTTSDKQHSPVARFRITSQLGYETDHRHQHHHRHFLFLLLSLIP